MTTLQLTGFQKQLGSFADSFLFPNSNKSVTTYKKVIEITTSKKSVNESKKMIDFLEETVMQSLPSKKEEVNIELVKSQLENITENKKKIDDIFNTIAELFDSEENVSIDDVYMIKFLDNMKKAQEILYYVMNYLSLVLEVQEAYKDSEENGKTYSFDEFKNMLLNTAA